MPRGIPNKKRKSKVKSKTKKRRKLRLQSGHSTWDINVIRNTPLPEGPSFVNTNGKSESPEPRPDSFTLLSGRLLEVISQQNALIREQNTTLQTLGRIMEYRR